MKHILVLKADHLGDLMLAAPAVYSTRKHFPEAKISLAATAEGCALYRALGLADGLIPIYGPSTSGQPLRKIIEQAIALRRRYFDLVVNFRHDYRDILFARSLRCGELCSYAYKKESSFWGRHNLLPNPFAYEADNHLALVGKMGVAAVPFSARISDRNSAEAEEILQGRRTIAVHVKARTEAKQWPAERFARLLARIESAGFLPVLFGGQGDFDFCDGITRAAGCGLNIAGKTDYPLLFALLQKAEAFIGVDSFIMHAAAACGLSGVAIFSGTNLAERWAPPTMTVLQNPAACAPCSRENCNVPGHPCMDIHEDRVWEALTKILDKRGR